MVHVVIPVYKNDKYAHFSEAVSSILNQTYASIQTTIAVDGPIDSTLDAYINELEAKKEVQVKRFKENRGLPATLNDVISPLLEQGVQYIARMDADDISDLSRIEKQMDFLKQNPKVDIVGTAMREMDSDGIIKKSKWFYPADHDGCYRHFAKGTCVAHATVIFRNSFFDKSGLYPIKTILAEDMDMWTEGLEKGAIFANLQEPLYSYRVTPDTFRRRKGLRTAFSYLTSRIQISSRLGYGVKPLLYHSFRSALMLMPTFVTEFVYDNLRTSLTKSSTSETLPSRKPNTVQS